MKAFEKYSFEKDLSYCSPELKSQWHRTAKAALKALAVELGLTPNQYDLTSNQAGVACSGEVTLHTDTFYIQASADMEKMITRGGILYRKCDGRKDYCGKQNHFAKLSCLNNTTELVFLIKKLTKENLA